MLKVAPGLMLFMVAVFACALNATGQQQGTVTVRPRAASSPGLPAIEIDVDKRRVPLGDEVTFTLSPASVIGNPQFAITIDFGDGRRYRTSRSQIVYLYRATGNYTATVSIALSGRGPQIQTPGSRVPRVTLSANPAAGVAPVPVNFTAQLSSPYPNVRYRFVFGDGSQSDWQESSQATHTYDSPGAFSAYVNIGVPAAGSVKQAGGSPRQRIEVTRSASGPVDLIVDPLTVATGRVVTLTARFRGRDPNVAYRFSFGDGSPPSAVQSSSQTTHKFATAGSYPVYVEVGRFTNQRFDPFVTSARQQVTVTQVAVTPSPTPQVNPTPTPIGPAQPSPTPGPNASPSPSPVSSIRPSLNVGPQDRNPAGPGWSWWWLLILLLLLIAAYQAWKLIQASRLTFRSVPDVGVADFEKEQGPLGIDFQVVLSPNVSEAQYELETEEPAFIRSERSGNA